MFPFAKPLWFSAPRNCSFITCTWESGLREEMAKSRFVIVPSLWSAPIEGALVKSIACAKAVLVVDNPTSYSGELPLGVVLKLNPQTEIAAKELMRAIEGDWQPNREERIKWINSFASNKQRFRLELLRAALTK